MQNRVEFAFMRGDVLRRIDRLLGRAGGGEDRATLDDGRMLDLAEYLADVLEMDKGAMRSSAGYDAVR